MTGARPVRVWRLELTELRPSARPGDVRRAELPYGPLNAFFYDRIGRDLRWTDRAGWVDAQWQDWAAAVETWIAYDRGTPAGYAELLPLGDHVDVAHFGLLAPFRGRGLGGALLTAAVARALELAPRVGVSTNELDGEHARANYEARGFRVVAEHVEDRA